VAVTAEVLQWQGFKDGDRKLCRCLIRNATADTIVYGNFLVRTLPHIEHLGKSDKVAICDDDGSVWFELKLNGPTEVLLLLRGFKDALATNRAIESRKQQIKLEAENQQLKAEVGSLSQVQEENSRLKQELRGMKQELEGMKQELNTPPGTPIPSPTHDRASGILKAALEKVEQEKEQLIAKQAKLETLMEKDKGSHREQLEKVESCMKELIKLHKENSELKELTRVEMQTTMEAAMAKVGTRTNELVDLHVENKKLARLEMEAAMKKVGARVKELSELHAENADLKRQELEKITKKNAELERASLKHIELVKLDGRRRELQAALVDK
jgi:DNA repair exonuclease SbcCD ATPase subunit